MYVASVGASGETPACVSLVAAPPVAAAAPLKPTHGTDGVPLLGQSLPRVRQQRVMPGACDVALWLCALLSGRCNTRALTRACHAQTFWATA